MDEKEILAREKIKRVVGEATAYSQNINLDLLLSKSKIASVLSLDDSQKKKIVDYIVERKIRPHSGIGKSTMARMQMLSILGVESSVVREKYSKIGGNQDNQEKAAVKPGSGRHSLSNINLPKFMAEARAALAHLVSTTSPRIMEEFIKLQGSEFDSMKDQLKNKPKNDPTAFKNLIDNIFGQMGVETLLLHSKRSGLVPLKWFLKSNLKAYMAADDVRVCMDSFLKDSKPLFGHMLTDDPIQVDERTSQTLREYFRYNSLLMERQLRNRYGIKTQAIMDHKMGINAMVDYLRLNFGELGKKSLEIMYSELRQEHHGLSPGDVVGNIVLENLATIMSVNDVRDCMDVYGVKIMRSKA